MPIRETPELVRDERGVALVEFVLVLPVFMLLLLGMLEFGKLINYWLDMTHLANEGARMAVVNRFPGCQPPGNANPGTVCTSPALQSYVAGQANTEQLKSGDSAGAQNGITPASDRLCIQITFPSGTHNAGDPVTVTARTRYNLIWFLGQKLNVPALTVKASSTMRLEQAATRYAAGGYYSNGAAAGSTCPS